MLYGLISWNGHNGCYGHNTCHANCDNNCSKGHNVIASPIIRDAIWENIVKIPNIDMIITTAAAITDVMATLSVMNTLF